MYSIFLTPRFLRFCTVGASGVVVNLATLALFDALGVNKILASAAAIEISILSNFAANDFWTFKDRGERQGRFGRMIQFQLVSLVGALVQFTVFVLSFFCWAHMFGYGAELPDETNLVSLLSAVRAFIADPPEVGAGMYLSQLIGIGIATGWNFAANLFWTWRRPEAP